MLRDTFLAEASMRIRWGRPLVALAVALAGPWLVAASAHAAAESSGDQVIVKFTSHSEAGQILSGMDLAAIAEPAEDPRLIEVARDFGARIGIPLRLQGLTSGRELLLAVDYLALASALAEGLRQRGDITGVEVVRPASEERTPRLEVEFAPGSAFAEMVASGPRIALAPVSGPGEIEAEVRRSERDRAVLMLDPDALMSALLARIEADPAVQYAQPDLRLRPYRAAVGGQG
jgi:hypothetical protein